MGKNRIKASPALARLAASTNIYVDEDGRLRVPDGRSLTAAQASTWKRLEPPESVRRDLARERLDRAIYDEARSRLSAAVGRPDRRRQQSRRRTNGKKAGR